MNYLFDVDGTLTPSRKPMDSKFRSYFIKWIIKQQLDGNRVYLVTGSDVNKTIEQVGLNIWGRVNGSYQNCGNQLWHRGELIYGSKWEMSRELALDIDLVIKTSQWYGTAKRNIEERVGMVNISTIGRDCTKMQRELYYRWDILNKERESIAKQLLASHKDIDIAIGGEISMDIYPKGKDKSQVLDGMLGEVVFFGDKCDEGGNDHALAKKVKHFNVSGWEETFNLLRRV
jgi:phosphomannomutase